MEPRPQPRTGMDVPRAREYGPVSYRMVQLFREMKPWARFVGVYSLAMAGLLFLFVGLCIYGAVVGDGPAAVMLSAALFYVMGALLSLFWGYFANQYASSIASIESDRGRAIEAALSHQKNVWRMMGVLAGLSAVLSAVTILLSVLLGVGTMILKQVQPLQAAGAEPVAGTPAEAQPSSPPSFWEGWTSQPRGSFAAIEDQCDLPQPLYLCLLQPDGSRTLIMGSEARFYYLDDVRERMFEVALDNWDGIWVFVFQGPHGWELEEKLYKDARWEVVRGEGAPVLKIAKGRHNACPSATGRFRVREIDGPRFVADFEQTCPETGERWVGRVAMDEEPTYR
jgi:hypothetical protein